VLADLAVETLRSLRAHRLRYGLTSSGIVWGILMLTFLSASMDGYDLHFADEMTKIGRKVVFLFPGAVTRPGVGQRATRPVDLELEDVARLAALESVESAGTNRFLGSLLMRAGPRTKLIWSYGATADTLSIRSFEVASGRGFTAGDVAAKARVAFLAAKTAERLFGWHAALFPTGRSGMHRITVGAWRDDRSAPMQVVSGPVGRERVHFEAPAAGRLDAEMHRFLEWFNGDATAEPVLKAALAHLWFVTIHPFDDGNGRIARAIADMSLARSEGSSQRFYSMSAQIRDQRAEYYRTLELTQRGTMNVTAWMDWFLGCLSRAIERSQAALSGVVERTRYWEKLREVTLNERQRLVIKLLLEGFEGKLTTSKWAALTKSSTDTALRDIQQLVDRGVLVRNAAGGRSTSYSLAGT